MLAHLRAIPIDYSDTLGKKTGIPYKVYEMNMLDFLDFKALSSDIGTIL